MKKQIVMLFFFICAVLLIWGGWSWYSIESIEEPAYEVIERNDLYEIRAYEPYIVAEVAVPGPYDQAMRDGFRVLADYIFGNNVSKSAIDMTAPVLNGRAQIAEEIAMTAPVLDRASDQERIVSFVMPQKYTLETLPTPITDQITFREVPARSTAALIYGLYAYEARAQEKATLLQEALARDDVSTVGVPMTARYNPPLSFPFLMRNEVLIDIE